MRDGVAGGHGARNRASALRMLEAIRRMGYAQRADVEPRSSSAIAVPIRCGSGVLASVGMTFFKSAVSRSDVADRYVLLVQELARNIEASVADLVQAGARPVRGEHSVLRKNAV